MRMSEMETDGENNSYVGRLDLKSYSKRWSNTKKLVFATIKLAPNIPWSRCWSVEKITTYSSRMWETMHCCNIWFGESQSRIPNSVRKKNKFDSISSSNGAVSCLWCPYGRIYWASHTKQMPSPKDLPNYFKQAQITNAVSACMKY